MKIEKKFDLREILIKTNYQIVIHKEKTFDNFPIAFGSGFFINYKENLFFLTADHNMHYNDHQKNERLGIDNYVGILNNISDMENLSTIISPIGGFYFMESYDLSKTDFDFQLFDVAISLLDGSKFKAPFLTDENFKDEDGNQIVSPKQLKVVFLNEHFAEPNVNDRYYIYGKIKPKLKGLFLHRQGTFKTNLRFVCKFGAYSLLNTEEIITDINDWAGLSGSPVINQDGKFIGVLCSVNENTKSVFVKPIKSFLPLLETIPLQERLLKKSK